MMPPRYDYNYSAHYLNLNTNATAATATMMDSRRRVSFGTNAIVTRSKFAMNHHNDVPTNLLYYTEEDFRRIRHENQTIIARREKTPNFVHPSVRWAEKQQEEREGLCSRGLENPRQKIWNQTSSVSAVMREYRYQIRDSYGRSNRSRKIDMDRLSKVYGRFSSSALREAHQRAKDDEAEARRVYDESKEQQQQGQPASSLNNSDPARENTINYQQPSQEETNSCYKAVLHTKDGNTLELEEPSSFLREEPCMNRGVLQPV